MSDDTRDQDEPVAGRDRMELEVRRRDGTAPELPLRLLMLGDYTGRPDDTPVEKRPIVGVDRDGFAAVLKAQSLALDLEVPDVLEQPSAASTMKVSLRIRRLADFNPEEVARQVPAVAAPLGLRSALTSLKGPLGGEKALRRKIEQLVDDPGTRRRLAAECGVALDDATVTEAREECTAARDEARSTADPRRLAELASHPSLRVRRAVATNPAVDDATARRLARMGCDEHVAANPSVRARAQASPERFYLPAGSFLHLEWTETVAAWVAGVDWDFLSQYLLWAYLLMEGPPEEASGALARPRCAADCIDRWPCWSEVSWEARRAAYRQLPGLELSRLLDARRAAVPGEGVEDALRHVAAHYPWHWRSVVERPECPRDVLETLAGAPQILVRQAVARHEATPEEVRRGLLADPDITVREDAHVRAGLPFLATVGSARFGGDELLVKRAWEALRTGPLPERDAAPLAPGSDAHPRAHQNWCQRLFERRSRARRGALPADVTEEQLWSFWSRSSKKWDTFYPDHDPADIVAHPRCPARVLAAVADDPRGFLQLVAAIHPNATDELLDRFATRAPPRDMLAEWRDFPKSWVRRAALTQRAVPAHLRRMGWVVEPSNGVGAIGLRDFLAGLPAALASIRAPADLAAFAARVPQDAGIVILDSRSFDDAAKGWHAALSLEVQPPFDAALLAELWRLPELFGVSTDRWHESWSVAVAMREPLSSGGSHRTLVQPVFGPCTVMAILDGRPQPQPGYHGERGAEESYDLGRARAAVRGLVFWVRPQKGT